MMMVIVFFAEWLAAGRGALRRAPRALDQLLFPRRDDDAGPPPGWFKHPPL